MNANTGSPFQYTVGGKPSGGSHRIEFFGQGMEWGLSGSKSEPSEFMY